MQNKKIFFVGLFLASFLCVSAVATAQETVKNETNKKPVMNMNAGANKPAEARKEVNEERLNDVQAKKEAIKSLPSDIVVQENRNMNNKINSVREENKIRLEEELNDTKIGNKTIVDFPNRASLGTLELAPLPGISEAVIGGPLPMAPSVSGKDLPSEQLLGRITPEVFQEMADLERGNTFLKLQLEKEKLKNDLEKLKATYRSTRLDEISKRENVVRSRIQWWQEQEKLRLEIEKKQAAEEELSRKIAEQEEARERIRAEKLKEPKTQPVVVQTEKTEKAEPVELKTPLLSIEELYTVDSIRGIGSNLSATLKSKGDGSVITVKKDDILPSGHVIHEIKKGVIMVAYGNRIDQLIFRPVVQ